MLLRSKAALILFAGCALPGVAAQDEWPFQQFPAGPSPHRTMRPIFHSALAREHGTAITAATRHGPNFAGHYTIAGWGCGTACAAYVIVDNATGHVWAPPELSKGVDLGISGPQFRVTSRLLVFASCPDPSTYGLADCYRRFYVWNGSELKLFKQQLLGSDDPEVRKPGPVK